MNSFESGVRKVIPAVLIYGRFEDKILMMHRNSGSSGKASLLPPNHQSLSSPDFHQGKWNGLGGKCELDESPLDAACREFQEESGLDVPPENFRSLGVLQFPNFKSHKQEDWIVFVFSVDLLNADCNLVPATVDSAEGTLHWISVQDLLSLNLWPGDHHFIPYVLRGESFIGTIWYDNFKVSRHWIQSLGFSEIR
ncbi:MAG: 8-oxo-dGTP diphosphatase [Bdellovibrionia bacterium]